VLRRAFERRGKKQGTRVSKDLLDDFGGEHKVEFLFGKNALELGGDFLISAGNNARKVFDNSDVGTETSPDGAFADRKER
jgi:hypothetical protein